MAALGAAALGALFACADAALATLTAARASALETECLGRRGAALRRVSGMRPILHSRYGLGRMLSLVGAVACFCAWLGAWRAPAWGQAAVAAGAIIVLGVLLDAATTIGRREADWVVPAAAFWLRPLELALAPIAAVTGVLAALVARSRRRKPNPRLTETEVEMMVNQGERSGLLAEEPAEMIRNVLDFSELTARSAMVPRTRVTAFELGTPIDEVLDGVVQSGHSRFPVYRGQIDEVVGVLYAKDLFRLLGRGSLPPPGVGGQSPPPLKLADIVRTPAQVVPESQPLSSLLRQLRERRQHLAIVVSEFGGMSGIVTLEDVIEYIVGDIQDETDAEEAPIVDLGGGRLLCDAAVLLADLGAFLGTDLAPDGQYDSLGGMLSGRLGQVPGAGTTVEAFGLRFVVREADEKRVAKVEIIRPDAGTPNSARPRLPAAEAGGEPPRAEAQEAATAGSRGPGPVRAA
ncbi:MAG: HlyC/CorC family transporter [Deltaproteobacteria bacterium]|nr:HlyC/CorC family transporter [Deltaproteobacteria bacterium]